MRNERFEELLQSVKEAAAIARGELKLSRTFEVRTGTDVDPLFVSIVRTDPFL